jgi:hypothetical protein
MGGTSSRPDVRVHPDLTQQEIDFIVTDGEPSPCLDRPHGFFAPSSILVDGLDSDWTGKQILDLFRASSVPIARVTKEAGATSALVHFDSRADCRNGFSFLESVRIGNRSLKAVPVDWSLKAAQSALARQTQSRRADASAASVLFPWYGIDYSQQIRQKSLKFTRILFSILPPGASVLRIVECPLLERFLHFAALTVGFESGNRICIGINTGSKTAQFIASVQKCACFPVILLDAVRQFERFVKDSKLPVFDPIGNAGFWKAIEFRVSADATRVLAVAKVCGNTQEALVEQLKRFRESLPWLTSVVLQNEAGETVLGEPEIVDSFCGLEFRIHTRIDFPVNIAASESFVKTIVETELIDKVSVYVAWKLIVDHNRARAKPLLAVPVWKTFFVGFRTCSGGYNREFDGKRIELHAESPPFFYSPLEVIMKLGFTRDQRKAVVLADRNLRDTSPIIFPDGGD